MALSTPKQQNKLMAHQSNKVTAFVTSYSPEPKQEEQLDTMPSDKQPPGTDEDKEYESLEEALTGA